LPSAPVPLTGGSFLFSDGQVHHDTHAVPTGNNVTRRLGNYVLTSRPCLGNYVIADKSSVRGTLACSRAWLTAGKATVLVRTVDAILGTHKVQGRIPVVPCCGVRPQQRLTDGQENGGADTDTAAHGSQAWEAARAAGVHCPGCGKPLKDASRNAHEDCPDDRRLWVSVPPPSRQ
jgi:hypothetical protein